MMKFSRLFASLAGFFMTLASCAQNEPVENDIVKSLLGPDLYESALAPNEMTVYLLNGWHLDQSQEGFMGYKVLDRMTPLTSEEVAAMQELLLTPANYMQTEARKSCQFVPNIGVSIVGGEQGGNLLVSLGCNQILHDAMPANERIDIDPAHEQMVLFFNGLFAAHGDVRSFSIKERRLPPVASTPPPPTAPTAPTEQEPQDTSANIATVVDNSTPAAPAESIEHIVEQGQTLFRLSQLYDVTVAEIRQWNGLAEGDSNIRTGQKIIIHQ